MSDRKIIVNLSIPYLKKLIRDLDTKHEELAVDDIYPNRDSESNYIKLYYKASDENSENDLDIDLNNSDIISTKYYLCFETIEEGDL